MKFSTVFVTAFAAYSMAAAPPQEKRDSSDSVAHLESLVGDVLNGVKSVSGGLGTDFNSVVASKGVKVSQRDIDELIKRADPGVALGIETLIKDTIKDLINLGNSVGIDTIGLLSSFIPNVHAS